MNKIGANWPFTGLALAFILLEIIGILALLFTGSWQMDAPSFLLKVNPILGAVGAFDHPIVPRSWFDNLPSWSFLTSSGNAPFAAINVIVYSALQWLGLGLLIDFLRKRA